MTTATAEQEKTGTRLSQLEQLKKFTVVVADTGDFQSIKEFKPRDATTNPSLIYAATQKEQYYHLLDEVLAKEGINCNLTLMFSLPQAVRCAESGIELISPFVGRIYDWYKAANKRDYTGAEDPGVQSVQEIYTYYKKFGHKTEVMGASFRNVSQILELAGCDLLTISPDLLEKLAESYEPVERKLDPEKAKSANIERLKMDEKKFRYLFN